MKPDKKSSPISVLEFESQSPEQKKKGKRASKRQPDATGTVVDFPWAEASIQPGRLAGPSKWVKEQCAKDPEYRRRYEEALNDIQTARTLTRLRILYRSEFKAHDNEKNRAKSLDPRLSDFRDWLTHMGPRPEKRWSVDRIKPKKGYLVGNMHWGDKQAQTDNQRVKAWHVVPGGQKLTTGALALRLGIKYDTLYQALRRGTPVERILEKHGFHADLEHRWRFRADLDGLLEPLYRKLGKAGQSRLQWFCSYLQHQIKRLEACHAHRDEIRRLEDELAKVEEELSSYRKIKDEQRNREAFALVAALHSKQAPVPAVPNVAHSLNLLPVKPEPKVMPVTREETEAIYESCRREWAEQERRRQELVARAAEVLGSRRQASTDSWKDEVD